MPIDVLSQFYNALAGHDEKTLKDIHIPMSDVFYVREKILQDTGVSYSLDHVERAMFLEGHIKAKDVLDPTRKRSWE